MRHDKVACADKITRNIIYRKALNVLDISAAYQCQSVDELRFMVPDFYNHFPYKALTHWDRHFAYGIFIDFFFNENVSILIEISLQFIP